MKLFWSEVVIVLFSKLHGFCRFWALLETIIDYNYNSYFPYFLKCWSSRLLAATWKYIQSWSAPLPASCHPKVKIPKVQNTLCVERNHVWSKMHSGTTRVSESREPFKLLNIAFFTWTFVFMAFWSPGMFRSNSKIRANSPRKFSEGLVKFSCSLRGWCLWWKCLRNFTSWIVRMGRTGKFPRVCMKASPSMREPDELSIPIFTTVSPSYRWYTWWCITFVLHEHGLIGPNKSRQNESKRKIPINNWKSVSERNCNPSISLEVSGNYVCF